MNIDQFKKAISIVSTIDNCKSICECVNQKKFKIGTNTKIHDLSISEFNDMSGVLYTFSEEEKAKIENTVIEILKTRIDIETKKLSEI